MHGTFCEHSYGRFHVNPWNNELSRRSKATTLSTTISSTIASVSITRKTQIQRTSTMTLGIRIRRITRTKTLKNKNINKKNTRKGEINSLCMNQE